MEEILKAEKAADDRKQSRASGFSKGKERDQGAVRLSNGTKMLWRVPRPVFPDKGVWVYPREIPAGKFVLEVKGKEILFDTEEFRKWLRWA